MGFSGNCWQGSSSWLARAYVLDKWLCSTSVEQIAEKRLARAAGSSAAKAVVEFAALAARLKLRPFKTKSQTRVFQHSAKPILRAAYYRSGETAAPPKITSHTILSAICRTSSGGADEGVRPYAGFSWLGFFLS